MQTIVTIRCSKQNASIPPSKNCNNSCMHYRFWGLNTPHISSDEYVILNRLEMKRGLDLNESSRIVYVQGYLNNAEGNRIW